MDSRVDNDPTVFVKMMHDFRTDTLPGRRMSALGFPGLSSDQQKPQTIAKPVKLSFDDSFLNETEKSFTKKRKNEGETPESLKLNDSFSVPSPWETRRLKADLVEARSEVTRLESRMGQMETVHKETIVLFEQEKKGLQQSLEKERSSTNDLEHRIRKLRKREAEMRQELLECQGSLRQDKLSLEKKYQTLLQENMLLKDKFSELDMDSGNKVTQLERKLENTEQQLVDIKEELTANKELMIKLTEELSEKRAESHLWENDKAKLTSLSQQIKELEYNKETHQKSAALVQAQQSKLFRMTELEKEVTILKEENKNLRQAITNKLYLEDVVADLRDRVSVLQDREKEILKLKVEIGVAQSRLQEWAEIGKHICGEGAGTNSPISLRQSFEQLLKKELLITSENTQLKSSLKTTEENFKESQAESEVLRSQVARLKLTIEQNNALISRLRKQNSLIIWERNDLRQLVDSCQKEFNVTTTAALDMQHISRMDALEKVLDGYRKRIAELESNPSLVSSGPPRTDSDPAELANVKLERDNLLKEKESQAKKIEELEEQIEYRALKGDFDVRQTKILHLKVNPTSEATSSQASELEKCQAEVLRLRERVKLLQEGQMHDLTAVVDDRINVNTVKEVEELKDKLSTQERQYQRLREAFKMTSQEFREAIYLLLGYKVDVLSSKKYRLTNLYAENPDHNLLFKMSQNGDLDLLNTPFSELIGDLIDIHLHQENSIPVFLSAITMQLFQKQTMCASAAPSDTEIVLSD